MVSEFPTFPQSSVPLKMKLRTAIIEIQDNVGPVASHTKPMLDECLQPEDIPTFLELIADGHIRADDDCDNDPLITMLDSNEVQLGEEFGPLECFTVRNFIFNGTDDCGNVGKLGYHFSYLFIGYDSSGYRVLSIPALGMYK